jgi:hypothetical protein
MKKNRKLTECQFIRLSADDIRQLRETAMKLDLPHAEITRRCLRLGMPILRKVGLPGTPKPEPEPSEAA